MGSYTLQNLSIPGEGQTAQTQESFEQLLGWNSVGVFSNAVQFDAEAGVLHVNNGAVFVGLADPYPEYRQFVVLNGEFHHSDTLLSEEYGELFCTYFENYGSATVYSLRGVEFIERDAHGTLNWTG